MPHLPTSIRAIAISMRGHGDASRPDTGYQTCDFEGDLVLFMDALGIDRAVILGASSGGFTARRFAADYPKRTIGLIMLGAPATLRDKPAVRHLLDTTIARLSDPIDPDFVRSFSESLVSRPIPADYFEMMLQENLKVPAHVWRLTMEGLLEETFPDDLGKIQAPVLLILGSKDDLIPREEQESLQRAFKNAALLVYPDAGHLLYWEQPKRTAADISSFIQSIKIGKVG
jgi:pimeloyl-ACP methyl ester carboxylesterase